MALITCPECAREVSHNASACPGCGSPIGTSSLSPAEGNTVPYSDQEVQVLLSKKHKTSHVLHLLLSIITVGFWVFIWLLVAINNGIENARIDRKIAKGKKF